MQITANLLNGFRITTARAAVLAASPFVPFIDTVTIDNGPEEAVRQRGADLKARRKVEAARAKRRRRDRNRR